MPTMPTNDAFRRVVETAARELVSVAHRDRASFVSTPLMYPSGANVVVSISAEGNGDTCFVSDFGAGHTEADMMGASSVYSRHARAIAHNAGIGFDEHSLFVVRAQPSQLAGAIASVANCSYEAVSVAAFRMAERE